MVEKDIKIYFGRMYFDILFGTFYSHKDCVVIIHYFQNIYFNNNFEI